MVNEHLIRCILEPYVDQTYTKKETVCFDFSLKLTRRLLHVKACHLNDRKRIFKFQRKRVRKRQRKRTVKRLLKHPFKHTFKRLLTYQLTRLIENVKFITVVEQLKYTSKHVKLKHI